MFGMRRAADFHKASDAIQEKHGSRKSGMRMAGQKGRARPQPLRPKAQAQFEF
jgi:hypothetical protein